jgi:hypothetical protein
MVAAQGAFKQSIPVVTVYTNLGQEAVRHSLEVRHAVICFQRYRKSGF